MEKILLSGIQEVVFSSSESNISKQISTLLKAGKLRKISSRIYSPNFKDSPEVIIRRNLFTILGKIYPNAVLSHRSALEFQPTAAGHIFLTYNYTKKINLPGLTIRLIEGKGAIEGDNILSGELYAAQLERALLENLQVSRQQGPLSKNVTLDEIEARLEQVIQVNGEKGINELRDNARVVADKLGMNIEFEKLNRLISGMLTSHPSKVLTSPLAKARAFGHPYDPLRLSLFEKLFIELKQQSFKDLPEKNISIQAFRNFAFFEAYFSNYIEGTEFELEEAKQIINTNIPMLLRHEDSHDILGTYQLVSNPDEMKITPSTADELLEIMLYRHKILLNARPYKHPGIFKNTNNRAGETHFVDHTLVKGTLIKGFDYYQALNNPFSRAIFLMFLISEVHPFLDGNGRIARVMMNAELVKHGKTKIIIPTVYRDDYVGALRKLTRQQDPKSYIRMMLRAQEFCATLIAEDLNIIQQQLEESNAFKEHDVARLKLLD